MSNSKDEEPPTKTLSELNFRIPDYSAEPEITMVMLPDCPHGCDASLMITECSAHPQNTQEPLEKNKTIKEISDFIGEAQYEIGCLNYGSTERLD